MIVKKRSKFIILEKKYNHYEQRITMSNMRFTQAELPVFNLVGFRIFGWRYMPWADCENALPASISNTLGTIV